MQKRISLFPSHLPARVSGTLYHASSIYRCELNLWAFDQRRREGGGGGGGRFSINFWYTYTVKPKKQRQKWALVNGGYCAIFVAHSYILSFESLTDACKIRNIIAQDRWNLDFYFKNQTICFVPRVDKIEDADLIGIRTPTKISTSALIFKNVSLMCASYILNICSNPEAEAPITHQLTHVCNVKWHTLKQGV